MNGLRKNQSFAVITRRILDRTGSKEALTPNTMSPTPRRHSNISKIISESVEMLFSRTPQRQNALRLLPSKKKTKHNGSLITLVYPEKNGLNNSTCYVPQIYRIKRRLPKKEQILMDRILELKPISSSQANLDKYKSKQRRKSLYAYIKAKKNERDKQGISYKLELGDRPRFSFENNNKRTKKWFQCSYNPKTTKMLSKRIKMALNNTLGVPGSQHDEVVQRNLTRHKMRDSCFFFE